MVGEYVPTDSFRAIRAHTVVCGAHDGELIAITGPAPDRKSEEDARLFAKAPILRDAVTEALGHLDAGETEEAVRVLEAARSYEAESFYEPEDDERVWDDEPEINDDFPVELEYDDNRF